jgi:hypothetical protein
VTGLSYCTAGDHNALLARDYDSCDKTAPRLIKTIRGENIGAFKRDTCIPGDPENGPEDLPPTPIVPLFFEGQCGFGCFKILH